MEATEVPSVEDGTGYTLIITGSYGTGKTCLWKRFAGEEFPKEFIISISCDDTRARTLQMDCTKIGVSVIDAEVFLDDPELTDYGHFSDLYSKCDGYFVVYDATDEETFNDLPQWLNQIRCIDNSPKVMLLGNKCDLAERKMVEYSTARDFADKEDIALVEVSAKDGTNVEFALLSMVVQIRQARTGAHLTN